MPPVLPPPAPLLQWPTTEDRRAKLHAWVNHRLNVQGAKNVENYLAALSAGHGTPLQRKLMSLSDQLADPRAQAKDRFSALIKLQMLVADGGNYEPLRKSFPDLAPYLNPPTPSKRGRGQKLQQPEQDLLRYRLAQAADDAHHARKIIRDHYSVERLRQQLGQQWGKIIGRETAVIMAARHSVANDKLSADQIVAEVRKGRYKALRGAARNFLPSK
jgi:hypothetical protein